MESCRIVPLRRAACVSNFHRSGRWAMAGKSAGSGSLACKSNGTGIERGCRGIEAVSAKLRELSWKASRGAQEASWPPYRAREERDSRRTRMVAEEWQPQERYAFVESLA